MPTADGDGAHLENVVEDDLVVFGPEKPFVVQFKFKMKIRKINLPSRDDASIGQIKCPAQSFLLSFDHHLQRSNERI